MGRLSGKVALITGAGSGQGAAEAELFAAEGAAVVITDINADAGTEVAARVSAAGGRAIFHHHDVTNEEGWVETLRIVKATFGGLHILINNAGTISRKNTLQIDHASWQRVMDVNLTGPLFGMKHSAPVMRDSGGGSIVNISSTAGLSAHYDAAYCASKWGLRGLTKAAAIDLVEWNIRVNSIHPAQILETSFAREGLPGHSESARRSIPMQRQGTLRECADLVLFLASDEASFITGAEVAIDGGFSAGAAIWMRNKMRAQIAAEERGEDAVLAGV